jgi:hypothetical protein
MTQTGTHVLLPLSEEMARALIEAIRDTLADGYGTVQIQVTPQAVKIAKTRESRFTWKTKP